VRRALIIGLVVLLLVAGLTAAAVLELRGDGEAASGEPIRITPAASTQAIVGTSAGAATDSSARLPGITVVGVGEVEVKPDVAIVRLTVGSGSPFSGSDGGIELVDETEVEPVVEALVDAGVPRDEIYVNTFGGFYGPSEDAALITLESPRPQAVKELLQAAQRSLRTQTDLNLQQVSVVFAREDCDSPESEATDAALADARKRAERLASLSQAKLGPLIAVSEAAAGGYLAAYAPPRCGASDLLTSGGLGFFEYQASASTAEEVTVTSSLEVTFALES
jgi:uncharacterized protein YggE